MKKYKAYKFWNACSDGFLEIVVYVGGGLCSGLCEIQIMDCNSKICDSRLADKAVAKQLWDQRFMGIHEEI